MNPLKPVAILIAGPLTLGLAVAAGSTLAFPELRTFSQFFSVFGVGAACSLAIFAPIVAALAFRTRLCPWIGAHGFAVQWYASVAMAFSLGYLFGSVGHKASSVFTALAIIVLFLCALAKFLFSIALRDDEPPLSGSGKPRPPLAPVPRPTGPRRRVFSEAAEVPKAAV